MRRRLPLLLASVSRCSMPSLADLPELIGFFSYSREDDEGSRGGLSALRDAIQNELSAQLGRTQADFRIWQDKAAISLGTLWERQITQGVNQSAFFVPIITPRVLKSQYCAMEFQAFLAREAELGRDDLVFPILYIPVPALEDEKLWRNDPILKVVGTRQYLDWGKLRHKDLQSIEVRERLELYCRGITRALQKTWVLQNQGKRRKEPEARQRAEGERPRRTTATRRIKQDELAGKAEEANRGATASNDSAVSKSGPPVLAPTPESSQRRMAIIVAAAFAVVLTGGGIAWFAMRPSGGTVATVASPSPVTVASPTATLAQSTPGIPAAGPPAPAVGTNAKVADAAPAAMAPAAPSPVPPPAPGPSPDEVAWKLIQDTNNAGALKRFIEQFPDSPRRNDADAQLTALSAAQAAWHLVEDSKDPDQLKRFVQQFPNSPDRLAAEQRIASLAAPAPDPHELTRSLQFELQRVGCFLGTVNGEFDDDTKTAWHRFIKLTSVSLSDNVSPDAINTVRGINKRVCPVQCPHGQHAEGEACIANAPPPQAVAKTRAPAPPPAARAAPPADSASPSIPLSIGIGGGRGGGFGGIGIGIGR
jgi:TIR domain